jgi:hypothetical protein
MDRGSARRLGGCITGVISVRTRAFALRLVRFATSAEVGFGAKAEVRAELDGSWPFFVRIFCRRAEATIPLQTHTPAD